MRQRSAGPLPAWGNEKQVGAPAPSAYVLKDNFSRLETDQPMRPSDRHRMAETAPLAQARTEGRALERGRVSDGPILSVKT